MSTITYRIRSVVSEVVRNNTSVHERWISDEQWLSILAITSELVTNKRAFNRALNDCTTINSVIGTKKRRHLKTLNGNISYFNSYHRSRN